MTIKPDLNGHVALVTGGSRGIGAAIAMALAEAGAAVAVNYLERSAKADAVVAAIKGKGGRAIAVAADVSQHRADWGMTIAPVAHAAGLGFIPFAEEHYDFALVTARKQRPAVQAFLAALASDEGRAALTAAGFRPG